MFSLRCLSEDRRKRKLSEEQKNMTNKYTLLSLSLQLQKPHSPLNSGNSECIHDQTLDSSETKEGIKKTKFTFYTFFLGMYKMILDSTVGEINSGFTTPCQNRFEGYTSTFRSLHSRCSRFLSAIFTSNFGTLSPSPPDFQKPFKMFLEALQINHR